MSNGDQVKKKGLSPLAWVGIGCGLLLVIGGIATVAGIGFLGFKAKEMAADFEANPALSTAKLVAFADDSLEVVDSNEEEQTVTFLKDGKEVVLSFEDIENGNFSWTTEEGSFEINASDAAENGTVTITTPDGESSFGAGNAADVPKWIVLPPRHQDLESSYSATTDGVTTGAISVKSPDSVDDVKAFYQKELEDAGYEVSVGSFSTGGTRQDTVSGTRNNGEEMMNTVISSQGSEPTMVIIQYKGPVD